MSTLSRKATPRPTQLTPEQARADFDELAPFFENPPGLLVVDSLVATVGASLMKKRTGNFKAHFSKSSRSQTSAAPAFDSQAETQARMFRRLLVKLDGFARACGAGMVVVELPVENMRTLPRYQSKRRRSDFLEHAAQDTLVDAARVELVLETNPFAMGVVRAIVAPNRFSRAGSSILIALNERVNAEL